MSRSCAAWWRKDRQATLLVVQFFLHGSSEEGCFRLSNACLVGDLDRNARQGVYTDNVGGTFLVMAMWPFTRSKRNWRCVKPPLLGKFLHDASAFYHSRTARGAGHAHFGLRSGQELVEHLEALLPSLCTTWCRRQPTRDPRSLTRLEASSADLPACSPRRHRRKKREEAVFDIVGHITRGAALITQRRSEITPELNYRGQTRQGGPTRLRLCACLLIPERRIGPNSWDLRRELHLCAGVGSVS